MSKSLSKAVLPMVPESVFSAARETTPRASTVTFVVNPEAVYSPQTGHPWFLEMDHEMNFLETYSLIPQPSSNEFVAHYQVESRQPRFIGKFDFSDAWLSTHRRVFTESDFEVMFTQTFFYPQRADDKLYFDSPPANRMEIVVHDRFIEDRELWTLLEGVVPKEYEIRSLVQRLS